MPPKPATQTGLILYLKPCNVDHMQKLRLMMLIPALSALACSHGAPPEPRARLSRPQFVAVMVDMEKTEPRARAAVLQRHKVTEADLRDFVKKYSSAPEYLALALDSIQTALDRANAAR